MVQYLYASQLRQTRNDGHIVRTEGTHHHAGTGCKRLHSTNTWHAYFKPEPERTEVERQTDLPFVLRALRTYG